MMCIEVENAADQMERRSLGNRSVQPEILDDANQIQIPEDLDDINFLERLDRQTEIMVDDKNALDIPNEDVEIPELDHLDSYDTRTLR